eukprot:6175929-Pleurochrysis_carterae.AAC.1
MQTLGVLTYEHDKFQDLQPYNYAYPLLRCLSHTHIMHGWLYKGLLRPTSSLEEIPYHTMVCCDAACAPP